MTRFFRPTVGKITFTAFLFLPLLIGFLSIIGEAPLDCMINNFSAKCTFEAPLFGEYNLTVIILICLIFAYIISCLIHYFYFRRERKNVNKLYLKTEKFVRESFNKIGWNDHFIHFDRTVFWIKQLMPDADEPLLLAGLGHDIDRAFTDAETLKDYTYKLPTFNDYLRVHQKNSAEIMTRFLKKQNTDKHIIDKVKSLISKHEIGGDAEQDVLKDADSLSFFENNIDGILKQISNWGKDKVKEKIDWMYKRISSQKARQIAEPWYQKALKKWELVNK